jgi:hypothetical protein
MTFWICFCVGLGVLLFTVKFVRSTVEHGASPKLTFLQFANILEREANVKRSCYRDDLTPIEKLQLLTPMRHRFEQMLETGLSLFQYIMVRFLVWVLRRAERKYKTVEPSQSVSSANSGEANA